MGSLDDQSVFVVADSLGSQREGSVVDWTDSLGSSVELEHSAGNTWVSAVEADSSLTVVGLSGNDLLTIGANEVELVSTSPSPVRILWIFLGFHGWASLVGHLVGVLDGPLLDGLSTHVVETDEVVHL